MSSERAWVTVHSCHKCRTQRHAHAHAYMHTCTRTLFECWHSTLVFSVRVEQVVVDSSASRVSQQFILQSCKCGKKTKKKLEFVTTMAHVTVIMLL